MLRRWAEARASERGTAVLRQFAYGANDARPPAPARGRLRAGPALLPPARRPRRGAAAGRRARCATFEPDDEAAVHRLIEDAFTEIEGAHADDARGVARARGSPRPGTIRRCGCWPRTSDGLAGAALGERWENATGYVAELAVAARARGRGLGRALLLGLFAAFRRAGLTHAELSVHGRNRGALALYESVGMRSTWEAERWEKALGHA